MTFAGNLTKQYTERSTFVRIEGTQIISESELTDLGSNYYDFVVDHKPTSVSLYESYATTTSYSEDTSLSSTETWYFTEVSNTLHIRASSALYSTDKILSDFMLTYTDGSEMQDTLDPVSGGDAVIWENRLKKAPSITETIKNATDGVMSVSATSLSLENSDSALNHLLSSNKVYHGREVKVWMKVDDEYSALFRGEVTTIDVTGTTVVFGVVEQSIQFDKPAYFGTKGNAIYGSSGSVVNKHNGRPIPIIIGSSPYTVGAGMITGGTYQNETLLYSGLTTAVCRSPSYSAGAPSTSQNRTWTMCRSLPSDSLASRSTGTGTITLDSKGSIGMKYNGVNVGTIDITATGGYTVREGDVIIAEDGTYSNVEVCFVVTKLLTSTTYRVALLPIQGGIPGAANVTSRFTMESNSRSHSGILHQTSTGNKYIMVEGMDFNLSTSVDSDGLTKNNAVFISNFEGSLYKNQGVGMTTLNPYVDEFRFYRHGTGVEHATMLEELLEADGLTVDSTSITNALADDVSGVCVMSIPDTNDEEFPTMREVLSEIVGSTFGYIRMDASGTVIYELFRVPSTPTESRTDDDVLSSSVVPRISYYDMASQYKITNRHLGADYKERTINDSNLPLTTESTLAQAVYRSEKVKNFKTVFLTASSNYLAQMRELFEVPRVTYNYATDVLDLNLTVGSTVTLKTSNLLGTDTSVNLLITNIIRSANKVTVTGIELT